ncbi:MAG: EamA family transporter, partial [Gemmatimonadota bacterium]
MRKLGGSTDKRAAWNGIARALAAAALFGATTPISKRLLAALAPQVLAGVLYLGSGTGLLVYWLIRRHSAGGHREAAPSRKDLGWLALAIGAGGLIAPVLLMVGLTRTPASTASLLLNFEGVFTALIAWIVLREHVDRRIALGMLAIVAGGVVLSWGGHVAVAGLTGPLLVIGACLAWAIDNNLTQKVSATDPVVIAGLKGLIAGSINLGLGLSLGGALAFSGRLVGAVMVGFLGYGVSLVLYVRAMRDLGTARTGAYFSLAPFVGAAIGLLFLGEPVSASLLVAATLMAFGLWFHLTERHAHQHGHDPLEHTHLHEHDAHHQHAHEAGHPPGEPHTHPHRHASIVHT